MEDPIPKGANHRMTITRPDANRLLPVSPFDMVVFGGTGDLAMRKLMPALLRRDIDGQIAPESRIIGIGRSRVEDSAYRQTRRGRLPTRSGRSVHRAIVVVVRAS